MSHALLSPSSAHRWLTCTRSARLELQFPDNAGAAASEGTLAHTLAELLVLDKSKAVKTKEFKNRLQSIESDPQFDPAMMEHCDNYAVFVMERFSEAQTRSKDALLMLEQKIDLTEWVPEGFGTGDTVIIADHVMHIIDLKYGKGVPVSAEGNKQMMLYGLGALRKYDLTYDIREVHMTIFQPRLDNISTFIMSAEDLMKWADEDLLPKAAEAFAGTGEFQPGSHCRFCRAKSVCRANAEYHLELAKYDFEKPVLLEDHEIADILTRADGFLKWLSGVSEHALAEAIAGKKWPGYKLVEGRSNRVYSDEEKVATKLKEIGLEEDVIYTKKLVTITALEKELGKKTFADTLEGLLIKPPGKPTLVPESDKRSEINSYEAAAKDFAEVVDMDI